MSTHIHYASTQLEKYTEEDRHICYVCRHSKLLTLQEGRLTKKVCRHSVWWIYEDTSTHMASVSTHNNNSVDMSKRRVDILWLRLHAESTYKKLRRRRSNPRRRTLKGAQTLIRVTSTQKLTTSTHIKDAQTLKGYMSTYIKKRQKVCRSFK